MNLDAFPRIEATEPVLQALAADGIERPTPVQEGAIAPLLDGASVLLHAGTGSGKTLAYLLPILQRLRDSEAGRAVVIAPGTELALQTLRVADAYRSPEVSTGSAVASTSTRRQRERVQRSTRLVVGTPARIFELFADGKLKGTHILVLDELEPILSAPGAEFLGELLSRSTPRVQLVVASATLGPRSKAFLERFLGPESVVVAPAETALTTSIRHLAVRVPHGRSRDVVLARFVQERRCRRAIVFVSDPARASHLFHFLTEHGLRPVTVNAQRSKAERRAGMEAFREGQARVLLLSDAMGRGLDVPGVEWVLHHDLPSEPQVYVHRAGRTGRAGAEGTSVVFVEDRERGRLRRLAEALELVFEPSEGSPGASPSRSTSDRRGR